MSADIFDDWCWANDFFREWASVNIPCGNREAVVNLWREMGRGWMWAALCKEECAMHGKEISFTFEREPEDWSDVDAEIERALAEDPGFLDAISQPDGLHDEEL
jgi:hypothetical protein